MMKPGSLVALLPLTLWFCTAGSSSAFQSPKFDHERPLPAYQCKHQFPRANDIDSIAKIYYRFVNWIAVDALSESFPVESLFENKSDVTLVPNAWNDSLRTHRTEWLSFENRWITCAVLFVAFALIFTVAFAVYSCCCKKPAPERQPSKTLDVVVGMSISVLIVILFYTVFLMFGSSLYAKRGAERWLPKRDQIDVCVTDIALFINDTEITVNDLAYNDLDRTVHAAVVEIRNVLIANVTDKMQVGDARRRVQDVLRNFDKVVVDVDSVVENLESMKESCVGALCSDVDNAQKAMKSVKEALGEVRKEKLVEVDEYASWLSGALGIRTNLEFYLGRSVVDREKEEIQLRASQLLEMLPNLGARPFGTSAGQRLDELRPRYQRYVTIVSWTFIGVSVFSFVIALIFLIGCTFETCGTKKEKGCCLRSTSSTVYAVGAWIAVLGMVLIAAAASLLAILAGNAANLVCDPLRRPTLRTDVIAVANEFWLKAMEDYLPELQQSGLDIEQLTLPAVLASCEATHRFGDFGLRRKVDNVLEALKHNAVQAVSDLLLRRGNGGIAGDLADADGKLEEVATKLEEVDVKIDNARRMLLKLKAMQSAAQLIEAVNEFRETLSTVNSEIRELRKWTKRINPKSNVHLDLEDMETELPAFASQLVDSTVRPRLNEYLDAYMNHANFLLKSRVCKPLGELALTITAATCDQVVDPINGVWHSIFSSLIFVSILIALTTYSGRLARRRALPSDPKVAGVKTDPVEIHVSSAPLEPDNSGAAALKPTNAEASRATTDEPQEASSLYPSVQISDN